MTDVIDRRDTTDRRGQQRHGVVPRQQGRSSRQALRRRLLQSALTDAAAIAALRADLQQVEAVLHAMTAALHELRRDQHIQAFLDGVGDPVLHQQCAERHRAGAEAERAAVSKQGAGDQGLERPMFTL